MGEVNRAAQRGSEHGRLIGVSGEEYVGWGVFDL